MQSKAKISPGTDGTFLFENGGSSKVCKIADDVGAELEEMIWPLIAPGLKARKAITITVQFGK